MLRSAWICTSFLRWTMLLTALWEYHKGCNRRLDHDNTAGDGGHCHGVAHRVRCLRGLLSSKWASATVLLPTSS
ncbi:hypothetical protein BU23DRAFT_239060 [Bimuria novae-zelandiae CBS 107.79]|uniref:Secreted protein n=1 Tax=Bimuria novae-zelandiae CBS 107.79 TaxID=1447943 RepID=A0A6A5UYC3_9PLEO|nr:hypothetical protein BU23DRAFT_239060 [Bimuria novae-zelandiae CBS 107.79]